KEPIEQLVDGIAVPKTIDVRLADLERRIDGDATVPPGIADADVPWPRPTDADVGAGENLADEGLQRAVGEGRISSAHRRQCSGLRWRICRVRSGKSDQWSVGFS